MSNPSLRRLAKDVAELAREPLDSCGIYYQHCDSDIRKATAVIRGPAGSAYDHGYYMFSFAFPDTYPAEPPKVRFLTSAIGLPTSRTDPGRRQCGGRRVRLHPNLYASGKVCLSLLGTWEGEPWTSCCTICTLLLALQSILDADPYMNEPNVRANDASHEPYNQAVLFHNLYDGLALFRRTTLQTLPVELQSRLENDVANSVRVVIGRLKERRSRPGGFVAREHWVDKYSFGTRSDYDLLLGLLESLQTSTEPPKLTESVSSVPA